VNEMKPTVKICGIRSADTLREMKGLMVHHIGFVFAPSKRQVSPAEAGKLIRLLHEEGFRQDGLFRTAGVFVNPTLEEIGRVLEEAPLDIVQLHGQEPPELCAAVKERFKVDIFKAASIPGGEEAGAWSAGQVTAMLEPYVSYVDAYLLDTYDPAAGGGSGRTFPWNVIPPLKIWAASVSRPLLIAGGLHAENVNGLLKEYSPDGVDVSSGVETDGVKDILKIRTFVERVKEACLE
jgi:phosphoribosylanthranilate isomerase